MGPDKSCARSRRHLLLLMPCAGGRPRWACHQRLRHRASPRSVGQPGRCCLHKPKAHPPAVACCPLLLFGLRKAAFLLPKLAQPVCPSLTLLVTRSQVACMKGRLRTAVTLVDHSVENLEKMEEVRLGSLLRRKQHWCAIGLAVRHGGEDGVRPGFQWSATWGRLCTHGALSTL